MKARRPGPTVRPPRAGPGGAGCTPHQRGEADAGERQRRNDMLEERRDKISDQKRNKRKADMKNPVSRSFTLSAS